ncbi:unnamed protein product [Urochloa decumbens]|uniref:Uncharacterized protein n=1 Tax=Urochloa decumbens TaxID=240449 RepID=A0ABC8XYT5_9POAL
MHASRTRAMLPVLSVCAVALLVSPACADSAWLDPAVGGDGRSADSPAEAPTAVAAALEWAGGEVADTDSSDRIAVPPGSQAFRTRHERDPFAFSPEQSRGLEHEAHCGPRVPLLGGAFPGPGSKPRCRGSGGGGGGDATRGGGGAASAPAVPHLLPIVDEP